MKVMRIAVFLHGTAIMHRSALGCAREERVRQVMQHDPSVRDYAAYVPVGNAVSKVKEWHQHGAEIVYLSSHRRQENIDKDAFVLERFAFPRGEVMARREGETYVDLALRVMPDIIVEDDCESIGGEVEMIHPNLPTEARRNIAGIVVREFEGLDHLPDQPSELITHGAVG
jgi:hypothetical protein